jgi:hypothetical protein
VISKETEAEILRLYHAEKWRIGTIAAQLHIHYTTVQRVLRQSGLAPQWVTERASLADAFVPYIVASGLGGYRIQRLQRDPGDHATSGEWSGAEGAAVLVALAPGPGGIGGPRWGCSVQDRVRA